MPHSYFTEKGNTALAFYLICTYAHNISISTSVFYLEIRSVLAFVLQIVELNINKLNLFLFWKLRETIFTGTLPT